MGLQSFRARGFSNDNHRDWHNWKSLYIRHRKGYRNVQNSSAWRGFCVQKGTRHTRVKLLEAGPKSTWGQPHGMTFMVNWGHAGVHRPVEWSISEAMPKLHPQQCSPVWPEKHLQLLHTWGGRVVGTESSLPEFGPEDWEAKHEDPLGLPLTGEDSRSQKLSMPLVIWLCHCLVNCFRRLGGQDAKEATVRKKDPKVMHSQHTGN